MLGRLGGAVPRHFGLELEGNVSLGEHYPYFSCVRASVQVGQKMGCSGLRLNRGSGSGQGVNDQKSQERNMVRIAAAGPRTHGVAEITVIAMIDEPKMLVYECQEYFRQ